MKVCKKCGELISYNSYFGCYYCPCCGNLEEAESNKTAEMLLLRPKNKKFVISRKPLSLARV